MDKQRIEGGWYKAMCVYKRGRGMFSSVCTSVIHTIKFHLLRHLIENVRRFGDISGVDASAHE